MPRSGAMLSATLQRGQPHLGPGRSGRAVVAVPISATRPRVPGDLRPGRLPFVADKRQQLIDGRNPLTIATVMIAAASQSKVMQNGEAVAA